MNKYKPQKTKVFSYLPLEDIKRLDYICKEYGYSSKYKLIQYLVDVFLRLIDPGNNKNDNPIPYEIERMFIPLEQYSKIKAKQNQERRKNRAKERVEQQVKHKD